MQVSAIQNQLTSSKKGIQTKKMPYSACSRTDSFSREKTNSLSFKGVEGAARGSLWGMVGGAILAMGVTVATGGAAGPFALAYLGTVVTSAAAGAAVGHAIEEKK